MPAEPKLTRPATGLARLAPAELRLAAGRLSWGVADQAVSSLSNFALGLYVAHTFDVVAFGAFSLAYISYAVVLNASRGCGTDPLLVRFSGAEPEAWRRASAAASATGVGVGIAAGAFSVAVGLVLSAPVGPAFVALGIALPALMLQDSWRFAFFAAGQGARALVNDLVWTLLMVSVLGALHVLGWGSVVACLLAFGGTALVAGLFGIFQAGVRPRPVLVPGWLHEHRQLAGRYMLENVSASGASQIRAIVLGIVTGLAAVGYLRGAELLMGPFLVVLMGLSQVAVPEAARALQRSTARLRQFCLLLGTGQAAAAALWGGLLLLVLPQGLGGLVLDDVWPGAQPLIPVLTLHVMSACLLTAAMAGLRAYGAARRSLAVQLVTSSLYVTLSALGAWLGGALGAAIGSLVANTLGTALAWQQLETARYSHEKTAGSPTSQ